MTNSEKDAGSASELYLVRRDAARAYGQRALVVTMTGGEESTDRVSSPADGDIIILENSREVQPPFTNLLVGVPNRNNSEASSRAMHDFQDISDTRWDKLRTSIYQKCGVAPEKITEEWVIDLLDEFTNGPEQKDKPYGYRTVCAAMLWEYLQGAEDSEIKKVAKTRNFLYGVTAPSKIRAVVVQYAGTHRRERLLPDRIAKNELAPRQRESRKNPELPDLKALDTLNRNAEKIAADRNTRPEAQAGNAHSYNGFAERFAKYTPGKEGAYRRIFGVATKVIVEKGDIAQARGALWESILENVSRHHATPDHLQLTNDDVRWLAFLCGKQLVVRDKKLEPIETEPRTISGIRSLVDRSRHNVNKSPDEVEAIILAALEKLIQFKAI